MNTPNLQPPEIEEEQMKAFFKKFAAMGGKAKAKKMTLEEKRLMALKMVEAKRKKRQNT